MDIYPPFIVYFSNIQLHYLFKYISTVCLPAHTSVYRYAYLCTPICVEKLIPV